MPIREETKPLHFDFRNLYDLFLKGLLIDKSASNQWLWQRPKSQYTIDRVRVDSLGAFVARLTHWSIFKVSVNKSRDTINQRPCLKQLYTAIQI